jgi:hypothetical protein
MFLQNQRELNQSDENSLSQDQDLLVVLSNVTVSEATRAACIEEMLLAEERQWRLR